MAAEVLVHKVTLGTGKVVLLRDMKLKDQELAARAVGNKAGENQFLYGTLVQKELVKILLVQVDGAQPSPSEKENLDGLFSVKEYMQVCKVIGKLTAEEDTLGEPQIEFVAAGN